MRLPTPIFPILVGIFLAGTLMMFIAGVFIFLAIQIFHEIYATSGILLACLEIILLVGIFSCFVVTMIKKYCFAKKTGDAKEPKLGIGKMLVSLVLMEIFKFYLRKSKNNN